MSHSDIARAVAHGLAPAGFDLVQPLSVAWYNDAVDPAYRVPDFGREHALALLIANTRALWPVFLAARAGDPTLRAAADPIDTYTARVLARVAATIDARTELRLASDEPPRRIAMQRLAEVSGLAPLSPSYLNVHPIYGPWIGLRGLIVVDVDGPRARPVTPRACRCDDACLPLFHAAMAEPPSGTADIARAWTRWVAVRDACPIGREHRYGDQQLRYHYLKDPAILDE